MGDETQGNDEAARRERAKRLRSRIERLTSEPKPAADPAPESPNDFVQRRMREEAARHGEQPTAE
jgi:hypothetical protein